MHTTTVRPGIYECVVGMEDTLSLYAIADEEPTLVEAGTATCVDPLTAALEEVGLDLTAIRNLVVGHYHLDHGGGAAAIAARSGCRVYLHDSMADWLVDPDRVEYLTESTAAALGGMFDQVGGPDPLSESAVESVSDDGATLDIGERTLELLHTPGHSPDHLAVWLPDESVLLSTEALGRYYPRADVFVPPTTIPRYDPEGVRANIERLRNLDPAVATMTHGGIWEDTEALFDRAAEALETFEERIPEIYAAHDEDLQATTEAVKTDLVPLADNYTMATAESTAAMCTRCVLQTAGLLDPDD
ncbi:MAG: MBL fold metallo-hydrolase [Halobacteriales archaeon]|nr:MBL fold metallo-hydrolase [Halobacteriales archaeon]